MRKQTQAAALPARKIDAKYDKYNIIMNIKAVIGLIDKIFELKIYD